MKPRLPTTTQEKLLCLCSIYTQNEDTDVSVDYSIQPIYTVESLQWRIKQESKIKVSNHWDRSSPEDEDEDMSEPMEDEDMITDSYEEEYVEMINVKTAPERRAALEGSAWSVSSGIHSLVPKLKSDTHVLVDSLCLLATNPSLAWMYKAHATGKRDTKWLLGEKPFPGHTLTKACTIQNSPTLAPPANQGPIEICSLPFN